MTNLLEKRMTPENFYGELWKKAISKNSILELEKERIYALYRIWIDGRISYFQLEDGLKMTNEKYREVIEKNRVQIREAFLDKKRIYWVFDAPVRIKTRRLLFNKNTFFIIV